MNRIAITAAWFLVAGSVALVHAAAAQGTVATGDTERDTRRPRVGESLLLRPVSINVKDVTLQTVLDLMAEKTQIRLQYPLDQIRQFTARITIHLTNTPLGVAFERVLAGTGLHVEPLRDGSLLVVRSTSETAQASGIVTGIVMDAATKRPVPNASVVIDSGRPVRTREAGGFTIADVPAGLHKLTVRALGYRAYSITVTVRDGATETVSVALIPSATTLTDVVTTATGDRRRFEVGNAVGTIKADSVVKTTLIRNMSDLLQARVPGVIVSNTDGSVGSPSKIRIRGVNSIGLNNDPIIILDGVRLAAQTTTSSNQTNVGSVNMLPGNNSNYPPPLAPSRLDDIDPNTIESIDVLRGPSASSLYGTDAANGVIVIKTKKGRSGAWRTSISGDNGWSTIPGKMPESWYGFGTTPSNSFSASCTLAMGGGGSVVGGGCTMDSVVHYNPQNIPDLRTFGTGTAKSLAGSVSGGSDDLQQFLSFRTASNVGIDKISNLEKRLITRLWNEPAPSWVVRPNTEQDIDGSSQTTVGMSAKADVSLTATGTYRNVLNGGSGINPGAGGYLAGLADSLLHMPSEFQRIKVTTASKRGMLASNANYTPWRWLLLNGTGGGDFTLRNDQADLRLQDCNQAFGPNFCQSLHNTRRDELFLTTLNGRAQLSFSPRSWINLQTSLGEQYSHTNFYSLGAGNNSGTNLAFGSNLLTPTPVLIDPSCSGCQFYDVTESRDEAATAGWYLEQSVGVFGLYTSFGFRKDVSSAFGSTVNKTPPSYPKLNLSYPLSAQSFFPKQPWISSLRLRLAYGQSGNQASQTGVLNNYYQSQATYPQAPQLGTVNTNWIIQLGNPQLKPERTSEWEGGFDISFLESERLHAEVTLYRKYSRDAIVSVTLPPSYGVQTLSESYNLGNVENRGLELLLDGRILDTRMISWQLTANITHNTNKLVHIASGFPATGPLQTMFREGYPLYGYWGYPVESYADLNGDGILARSEMSFGPLTYMGAPYPKGEVTYSSNLSLFGGDVNLNASLDQIIGQTTALQVGSFTYYPRGAVDPTSSLAEQAGYIQAYSNPTQAYIGAVSSVRLNELSVTYNVPAHMARALLHVQSLGLTLAGRNLALWSNYVGKDPNIDTSGQLGEATRDGSNGIPQPRNWTLRFNLGL